MKISKMLLFVLPLVAMLSCDKRNEGVDHEDENEREINVNDLPTAVKNSINEQFSGAELLEADEITQKNGSLTYDVEIKHQGRNTEVMYDSEGKFLGEEKDDNDKEDKD